MARRPSWPRAGAGFARLPGPLSCRGVAGSGRAGGVLTYTGARVGALARLRRGDLQEQESQRVLRFREKGGKQREIPVRHDLDEWIDSYLEAARIDLSQKAAPLFLAADRWGLGLLDRAMTAHGVRRMLKRRLKEAGLPEIITPHSFRVMVVTDLLGQNVPMEDVAVPGRALQSPDHPDLRSPQASGDPQHRRAHLGVRNGHCHVNRVGPQRPAWIPFQAAALALSHTLNASFRNRLNVNLFA